MTGLKIEGVVFDVDGVLFDTERLTQQTWLAVSREMGWPQVGEAYLEFVGQNRADIFQKMEDLLNREYHRPYRVSPHPAIHIFPSNGHTPGSSPQQPDRHL